MSIEDLIVDRKNNIRKQQSILSLRLCSFAPLCEKKLRIIFLTAIACFSFLLSSAQPVLKTTVDKSEILIGEQFKLTIAASPLPDGYKINWPVIPDSLQHFEVISRSKIDSLYNNNLLSGLMQTITFTSFDSGQWALPPFLIGMAPVKADTTYNFFTDSVPITVSFSISDTTSQLKDIKPIREVETVSQLWYWIGGGLLLVALVVFFIWLYRRGKKKKPSLLFQSKTSPYDEAMKELENLKKYNLLLPTEIKIVHSKLGEIIKRYLSRSENNDFNNKTTSDILIWLNEHYNDKDMLAKAAASLRCSDAVKFAKYLPPAYESEQGLQSIKEVIDDIQQQTLKAKSSIINQPKTVNQKP